MSELKVPVKTETIAKELSHASVYLHSYVEQLEYLLSTQLPRITNQDVREINTQNLELVIARLEQIVDGKGIAEELAADALPCAHALLDKLNGG